MKNLYKKICVLLLITFLVSGCSSKPKDTSSDKVLLKEISFSGFDLHSGEMIDNEVLSKDINLVTIWQPFCPPCEVEMKAMNNLKEKFQDVNFIGLCVSEDSAEIIDSLRNWDINLTNYRINYDFLTSMEDILKVTPTLFIVDPSGSEIIPYQESLFKSDATIEEVEKNLEKMIVELQNEK